MSFVSVLFSYFFILLESLSLINFAMDIGEVFPQANKKAGMDCVPAIAEGVPGPNASKRPAGLQNVDNGQTEHVTLRVHKISPRRSISTRLQMGKIVRLRDMGVPCHKIARMIGQRSVRTPIRWRQQAAARARHSCFVARQNRGHKHTQCHCHRLRYRGH